MAPVEILSRLEQSGLRVRVEDGKLIAGPREALTDELRALMREHRDDLLSLLQSRADFEARRERVLAMLRATTGKRLAVLVDDPDTDPVMVAVALRNTSGFLSFEVMIPKAKYDAFQLLDLVHKHSSRELAVIDGGKSKKILEPGGGMTTRDERVKRVISLAPESSQKTLARAFSGSASPRQAIKAMCMACVGFDRNSIRDCTGWSCPLWKYRPFQDDQPEEPDCVYEARNRQGLETTTAPVEAWCRIHGFDCPNAGGEK